MVIPLEELFREFERKLEKKMHNVGDYKQLSLCSKDNEIRVTRLAGGGFVQVGTSHLLYRIRPIDQYAPSPDRTLFFLASEDSIKIASKVVDKYFPWISVSPECKRVICAILLARSLWGRASKKEREALVNLERMTNLYYDLATLSKISLKTSMGIMQCKRMVMDSARYAVDCYLSSGICNDNDSRILLTLASCVCLSIKCKFDNMVRSEIESKIAAGRTLSQSDAFDLGNYVKLVVTRSLAKEVASNISPKLVIDAIRDALQFKIDSIEHKIIKEKRDAGESWFKIRVHLYACDKVSLALIKAMREGHRVELTSTSLSTRLGENLLIVNAQLHGKCGVNYQVRVKDLNEEDCQLIIAKVCLSYFPVLPPRLAILRFVNDIIDFFSYYIEQIICFFRPSTRIELFDTLVADDTSEFRDNGIEVIEGEEIHQKNRTFRSMLDYMTGLPQAVNTNLADVSVDAMKDCFDCVRSRMTTLAASW